jgi:hypothetical protein
MARRSLTTLATTLEQALAQPRSAPKVAPVIQEAIQSTTPEVESPAEATTADTNELSSLLQKKSKSTLLKSFFGAEKEKYENVINSRSLFSGNPSPQRSRRRRSPLGWDSLFPPRPIDIFFAFLVYISSNFTQPSCENICHQLC